MTRTEQLIAKGREEYNKIIATYEEMMKDQNKNVAENSAEMVKVFRGLAADDERCKSFGFRVSSGVWK